MEKHVPYQSYLIRLWPTRRGGVAGYRVSLESVATREREDFPDLESLFAFLRTQGGGSVHQGLEEASDGRDDEFAGSSVNE